MKRNPLLFALRSLPPIALLFALCALPFAARAQSATATLSGTVEDQNGAVVPGVVVAVLNVDTSLRREATTNDSGSFVFTLLPPGRYALTAEHQGFKIASIPNLILNVGDQKTLQIQLKTGDVSETVNVTAESPLISESPAVATTVDRQFAANIPLNGRSFQSLITLTPGVVTVPASGTNTAGQFSVNGQRPSANNFTVDGVSANFGAAPGNLAGPQSSGNLPGLTVLGTTQSLVSVDALEEFKVQSSSYAAEYGRQPGGQISIVTRSGGNQFHGSVFDYLRNDVLDANDWFANRAGQPRPTERQNDFGGTFSGPIFLPKFGQGYSHWYNGRNKTFFFFSYEGLRLRQPNFSLTNVPTRCLRGLGSCAAGQIAAPASVQPILNAFPRPNGKDLGNGLAEFSAGYSDPSSVDSTSFRIDHVVKGKLTLFGRYSDSPSETLTRAASVNLSLVQGFHLNTKGITVGATASLTPRVSNELRVNYTNNRSYSSSWIDDFGEALPPPRSILIPSPYDSPTAQGTVFLRIPGITASFPAIVLTDQAVTSQRQFNAVNNLSYARGSHQLKFGVDYRRLTPIGDLVRSGLQSNFRSLQQILAATAQNGAVQAATPVEPVFVNFSVFGQDVWRLSRRLTLELGLRWEVNPAPSEAHGVKPATLTQIDNLSTMNLALGKKSWTTTFNNFAPRFGVAYQLREMPGWETVLRGGFGVFYDTGNDLGASPFIGFPYAAAVAVNNITYPLSATQLAPPSLPLPLTPPYLAVTAFDPELKLPYTLGWNLAVEQSVGKNQALTVSYVGAAGRRLLKQTQLNLSAVNPSFTSLFLTRNEATSDYHAFQAQFRRRLSRGLQALASYSWSHALDEDSNSNSFRVGRRGNAVFDIRHVFASAVTYDIPRPGTNPIIRAMLGGWSIDSNVHIQSALPVDITATTLTNPADGSQVSVRPNVIPDVPFYLYAPQYPGGRILNNTVPTAQQIANAGCRPLSASTPAKGAFCTPQVGQSGNLGRNEVRALGGWQIDFALRRQFKLTEKLSLQFRAEAFNLFNHPNFGTIQTTLSAANFGEATNMLGRQLGGLNALYQIGGPRSVQFAMKMQF